MSSNSFSRRADARELNCSPYNRAWVDHNILVLHNPYAYHPVAQEVWRSFPQFVPVGDQMEWTDGEKVIV